MFISFRFRVLGDAKGNGRLHETGGHPGPGPGETANTGAKPWRGQAVDRRLPSASLKRINSRTPGTEMGG